MIDPLDDSNSSANEEALPPEEDSLNYPYSDGLDGFYGGGDGLSLMDKHNDLLKDLTNFHPFVRDKVNGWLGLAWDENSGKYVEDPDVTPIMNRKCAKWCSDVLKTYARGNNIITDVGHDEYCNIMSDVIETMVYNLGCRMEEFGIRHEGDLKRLYDEIEHSAALILMGAGDGKYNKFLSTVTNRHESINMAQGIPQQYAQPGGVMMAAEQPRKKGILGKLKSALVGG